MGIDRDRESASERGMQRQGSFNAMHLLAQGYRPRGSTGQLSAPTSQSEKAVRTSRECWQEMKRLLELERRHGH